MNQPEQSAAERLAEWKKNYPVEPHSDSEIPEDWAMIAGYCYKAYEIALDLAKELASAQEAIAKMDYISRIQAASRSQIEAEIMAKQHSDGLIAGIALSAAFLINGHGEDSIAEDLLRETGIRSLSELRDKKVDNYDLDILKKVLPEKEGKNNADN